jgi:probable HAF family extracellular repeat protein
MRSRPGVIAYKSQLLLAAAMMLAIAGCTSVSSVKPVGDEPVYLEPRDWEGQWVNGAEEPDDPRKETITVNVVDAAGGVLEICGLISLEEYGGKIHAVIRQHHYKGAEAQFISFQFINFPFGETSHGYDAWGLFHRAGNALIIWWPVDAAFEKLAEQGEIAAKRIQEEGEASELLIEQLPKEALDQISLDSGRLFFNYQHQGEGGLDDTVWFRTSAVPSHMCTTTEPSVQLTASADKGVANQTTAPPVRVTLIDLGKTSDSLHGAYSINNAGQILEGASVWHDGAWSHPPEVVSGVITALNNRGSIVGNDWALGNHDSPRATLWDKSHGVVYLGNLESGLWSAAEAVNDQDQVVGHANVKQGDSWSVHAFLWEKGFMTDLGAPEGVSSYAKAINASGEVVGEIYFSGSWRDCRAFIWTRSTGMKTLGTLGGVSSAAHDINDAGDVVGDSKTVQGYSHPFLWRQGGNMIDLGTLGGRDGSAEDINNAEQVVGWSNVKHGEERALRHAFLWQKGQMIDLSELPEVKASGWSTLKNASGINDLGQIVGTGIREDGPHGFLLTLQPASSPSP